MPSGLRGGTETFWRAWGAGPPSVLLIHCTLAHSGAWSGLAQRLGRSAVAFDMPGHGRSGPWDRSRDYQTQCLRVAEDFAASGPVDIVGHSFGATVALRLAVERPELVRRLVLIEPVFFAAARGSSEYYRHIDLFQPFIDAIEAGDRIEAARTFIETWDPDAAWQDIPAVQQAALADQIELVPAQDGAIFEDTAGLLASGRLEAAATPVLLLEGLQSPPIIGAINEALAERLPNADRSVVPDAGHMLPITHSGEVAALITPFLRG